MIPSPYAQAMRKLVGERDQLRTMGARSRKLAEELYDVDKVNAHLWRAIGRALKFYDPTDTP